MLNVKYLIPTRGDGNCWYRAIVEQIHRNSVFYRIPENCRSSDIGFFRLQVVDCLRRKENENEFTYIKEFRNICYPLQHRWNQFLLHQEADTVFCGTFGNHNILDAEIRVTTENCDKRRPIFHTMITRCFMDC